MTCGEPHSDRYCWTCGTPAGGPVVSPDQRTYRVRAIGLAAVTGVALVVIVSLASAFFSLVGRSLSREAALLSEGVLAVGFLVAYAMAAVLVIIWLYRARANLEAFPGATPGWSPGWAIAGWLIPLANMVIPGLVMAGVARNSLYRSRTAPLVAAWWVPYVLSSCLSRVGGGALLDGVYDDPGRDHVEYYSSLQATNIAAAVLVAVSGAVLAFLIVRISAAQEERIDRALPPPLMPGMPVALPAAGPAYAAPPGVGGPPVAGDATIGP